MVFEGDVNLRMSRLRVQTGLWQLTMFTKLRCADRVAHGVVVRALSSTALPVFSAAPELDAYLLDTLGVKILSKEEKVEKLEKVSHCFGCSLDEISLSSIGQRGYW